MVLFAATGSFAALMRQLIRILLVVPEAAIITVLLAAYAIVPSIWIGVGISLLVITFISRIAALYLSSQALFNVHWDTADALATVASALHPWSPDALALRGAVALARGNGATAVRLLQRARRLAPHRSAIIAALSGALLEQGDAKEAEIVARQALELDPANAAARLYLAQALAMTGAPGEVVEDQLRLGLAHRPEPDAEASLRCALAHHLVQQGRLAEATLTLNTARAVLHRCSAAQRAIVNQQIAAIDQAIHARRDNHAA